MSEKIPDERASGTARLLQPSNMLRRGMAAYGHTTMHLKTQLYCGLTVIAGIILIIGIVHHDIVFTVLAVAVSATMIVMVYACLSCDILIDRWAAEAMKKEMSE